MSIIGKIQGLFSDRERTQPIFPITKTKAVSDDNGVSLDVLLADKASESFVTNKIAEAQLGGDGSTIDLSGYATKDDLIAKQDAFTGLTPSMVMICNSSGQVTTSSQVSTGELGYLSGVTSNIQPQLNKIHKWQGSFTGDIDSTGLNGLYWLQSGNYTGTAPDDIVTYAFLEATERHQKLIYYSSSSITKIYERYYTNDKWYDWKRTDSLDKQDAITGAVSNLVSDNLNASIVPISNASGKIISSNITVTELNYLDGVTSAIQTQLNNKAPTGYGLGTGCQNIDSVFSISNNGWWLTNGDTPSGSWLLCQSRVTNNSNVITVDAWNMSGTTKYKITKRNGTWGNWEYEIPLMTVGIEYPTTEKYMGKTVWTVIVDLGTCPVGETTVTTDFAATAVVRQAGAQSVYESARNDKYMHVHMASVEYGKLTVVIVKGTMLSSSHEYCQVWYTKD